MNSSKFSRLTFCLAIVWGTLADGVFSWGEDLSSLAALQSIRREDAQRHVDVLADDSFEGRKAGSRGGRAAGNYLQDLISKYGLEPAGERGTYFQLFPGGSRNVLGMLPGSDATSGVIVIGAHYDHVGYGSRTNSFGPFGYVHNGADDNASGTAALLEVVQAFTQMPKPPKRSVLFAFWDAEEDGLLGSKYWIENPTVERNRIQLYINLDMVGRLRNETVEVFGTRTGQNLRQAISRANQVPLKLDFRWDMTDNSDHYTFYLNRIPALMLHTGLHDQYHRPQDDAHLIDHAGIEKIARLTATFLWQAANAEEIAGFREQSGSESDAVRDRFEASQRPNHRARLGLGWDRSSRIDGVGLRITSVSPNMPAEKAGVLPGDVLTKFAGIPVAEDVPFLAQVQAAPRDVELTIIRDEQILNLPVQLALEPIPIGISWKIDPAEPHSVMVTQVIPGTLAAHAGLRPLDRIYAINGRQFRSSAEFHQHITRFEVPTTLLVERDGSLQEVKLRTDWIETFLPHTESAATGELQSD